MERTFADTLYIEVSRYPSLRQFLSCTTKAHLLMAQDVRKQLPSELCWSVTSFFSKRLSKDDKPTLKSASAGFCIAHALAEDAMDGQR